MANELFDNLYKMAALMEENDRNNRRYGTAGSPEVVADKKPFLAGHFGYKPQMASRRAPIQGPQEMVEDGSTGEDVLLSLGEGTVPVPTGKWVRPAVPGRLGTDMSQALLPYAASIGKDPEDISADVQLLGADPTTADLKNMTFGAKKASTMITISKDIAAALKTAGLEVEEGESYTKAEYANLLNAAKLGLSAKREKRMQEKAPAEAKGRDLSNKIKTATLTNKEADAAVNAEIAKAMGGTTEEKPKESKNLGKLREKFLGKDK